MGQGNKDKGDWKTPFISSTSIDLPEHQRQVIEACPPMGYHPVRTACRGQTCTALSMPLPHDPAARVPMPDLDICP